MRAWRPGPTGTPSGARGPGSKLRRCSGAAGLTADGLWGWKLPETMLALPQVLRTFPHARVVHLVRHPVSSALRRTHTTSRMDNPIGQAVLPAAYRACGLDPAAIPGDEPHLHNAASWRHQVGSVLAVLQGRAGESDSLQLHYEDVCTDPASAQRRLAGFLGLPVPNRTIAAGIDPARSNPVAASDAQVEQVWSICGETAAALGYDCLLPLPPEAGRGEGVREG